MFDPHPEGARKPSREALEPLAALRVSTLVPRLAKILLAFAALVVIAFTIAGILKSRASARSLDLSTRTRAIHQALVSFAQNNGDQYPPPDHVTTTLVECGLIDAETFNLPGTPRGEPSLFYISPTPNKESWSNSFKPRAARSSTPTRTSTAAPSRSPGTTTTSNLSTPPPRLSSSPNTPIVPFRYQGRSQSTRGNGRAREPARLGERADDESLAKRLSEFH